MRKPHLSLLGALALLAISAPPAYGQGLPEGAPAALGLSPERLERIDRHFEEQVASGTLPGAVAVVIRDGQVAYARSFGRADREAGRAMETDVIVRIASMTKPIVSVAAMMLYEEGHFRLHDSVARFIPEFADAEVLVAVDTSDGTFTTEPARRPVTIRDLLTHTSGISYGSFDPRMRPVYQAASIPDAWTLEPHVLGDRMRALADLPLAAHPGERFVYGMSTDMVGYLVEVISGQPLDAFLAERIFRPLGMDDTHFYLPPDKADRLAAVYGLTEDGAVERYGPEADYPTTGAQTYFSGGGGLASTAPDYARFAQMLLNGGTLDGVRLLSPKTVQLMTANHIGDRWGEGGSGFGLGFSVVTDLGAAGELTSEGVYGWGGYWGTDFWVDPAENLIGIFLSQMQPSAYDAGRFRVLVYQALVDPQPDGLPMSER